VLQIIQQVTLFSKQVLKVVKKSLGWKNDDVVCRQIGGLADSSGFVQINEGHVVNPKP